MTFIFYKHNIWSIYFKKIIMFDRLEIKPKFLLNFVYTYLIAYL